MDHTRYGVFALTILWLCCLPPPATGESLPLWEIGAGMITLARPDYPGADEESLFVLPFPYVVYRGDLIRADDRGIKGLLFDSERFELDISGGGSLPVNSEDNSAREGMPDLDPAFELGPEVTYKMVNTAKNRFTAELKWRGLVSVDFFDMRYQGWVLNPELRWEHRFSEHIEWGASLESLYGNQGYHAFFFDVDRKFATADRPAYRSRRGYSGTQAAVFLYLRPSRDWRMRWQLTYMDLSSVAYDDSPLYKQDYGLYFSFYISRILFKSSRLVQ